MLRFDVPDMPYRWLHRLMMWSGHYTLKIVMGVLILNAASAATEIFIGGEEPAALSVAQMLWNVAAVGLIALTLIGGQYHRTHLCPHSDHIRAPTDPATAVERHHRALRWNHTMTPRRIFTAAAALIVLVIAAAFAGPAPLFAAIGVAAVVSATAFTVSAIHHRLEAYCPYCRGDGDGGYFPVEPVPPSHTNELV